MLQFPMWKNVAIVLVCLAGLVVAFPNLFYDRVERSNDARASLAAGAAETPELAAEAAGWPEFLPSGLVNLGLDLRGGAHVLVEVQTADVYAERLEGLWPDLRDRLRDLRDQVGTVRRLESAPDELRIRIGEPSGMAAAEEAVRAASQPVISLTGASGRDFEARAEGDVLVITLSEAEKVAIDRRTLDQSLEIIRRRVDETGTREPTIQRQGEDRILVQVPGIGSAEELLAIIGKTARLSFHPVVNRTTDAAATPGLDEVVYPSMDEDGVYYVLERRAVVTGEQLVDSQPTFDQNGLPAVSFRFNPAGGAAFGRYTADNIGKPFAIVLDGEVISAPVIQSHIPGGSGIITGNFTPEDSTRLAILLRAGALPAEIRVLEQRTIGPELGQDSIEAGRRAAVIALAAVGIYMILSYGWFGVVACVALLTNIVLIFALMTAIGATLTMPGIAGLVLTIGMAVDANVLIFERIREELKTARGPARAIQLGFEKAFGSILDANVTTLIVAVILFMLGSGPVKGFAVTLGLGILCSVFTAIYVTQMIIAGWFDWRRPKAITV
ncbi:MAG TPA: protein translocase subunit SecD [Amaricoccus sp.]|uniref:protein translocase subunit SecD n=1 Tax=Amaricoccus sp. TaxID=1872485 RepID=UPI001DA9DC87|nr:protein translocase subunit SecD [Amaricoccus sp.]MCB1373338.1 protein translocase subunit SecD [Paracoccaceae bacterium]HPG23333.1 protein translocase subunit SecD [Amaricoccus sp.]HRW15392.1 protein translocase subunit SecD [Amaricoccus sp.]